MEISHFLLYKSGSVARLLSAIETDKQAEHVWTYAQKHVSCLNAST